jgi:hypothetical protein
MVSKINELKFKLIFKFNIFLNIRIREHFYQINEIFFFFQFQIIR